MAAVLRWLSVLPAPPHVMRDSLPYNFIAAHKLFGFVLRGREVAFEQYNSAEKQSFLINQSTLSNGSIIGIFSACVRMPLIPRSAAHYQCWCDAIRRFFFVLSICRWSTGAVERASDNRCNVFRIIFMDFFVGNVWSSLALPFYGHQLMPEPGNSSK